MNKPITLRDEITRIVGERPGIVRNVLNELLMSNTELADELDLDPKKIATALRNMVYNKNLSRDKDGHYTWATPEQGTQKNPTQRKSASLMLEEQRTAVLSIIHEHPGISNSRIFELLPQDIKEEGHIVDLVNISLLMMALSQDGLIARHKDGYKVSVETPSASRGTNAQLKPDQKQLASAGQLATLDSLAKVSAQARDAYRQYINTLNDPTLEGLLEFVEHAYNIESNYRLIIGLEAS